MRKDSISLLRRTRELFDFFGAHFPRLYARFLEQFSFSNAEKQVFLRRICRGQTVFDIGANFGYFSLLFSKIVGNKGHVYSFEPCVFG